MLGNILLFLLLPLLAVTTYSFYNIYLIVTRGDLQIAQLLLALAFTFILFMLTLRCTQTLLTQKISENLKADPSMSAFRWFMMLLGLPAIIVPAFFIFSAFKINERSAILENLGREQKPYIQFTGDPMFFIAFIGGICFVTFGILYPIYVKRLVKQMRQ